jgi:hypothetical protein
MNEKNMPIPDMTNSRSKDDTFLDSMSKIFPTRVSFFVFIAYMALFINQGIYFILLIIQIYK